MRESKTAFSTLLALVAVGIMSAQTANAGTVKTKTYDVRYNPNDLAHPDGAQKIIHSIHQIANDLCWDELGPERHIEKVKVQRCLRDVTQDLVDKVGHINLNAAHTIFPVPRKLTKHPKNSQWVQLQPNKP